MIILPVVAASRGMYVTSKREKPDTKVSAEGYPDCYQGMRQI